MPRTTGGDRTAEGVPFEERDWVRVGTTLRLLRETRGFKPAEFANEVGISTPYLHNIEAGRKKLTNQLLAKGAYALRVPQIAIMRPRSDQVAVPDVDYRDPKHPRNIVYPTGAAS